MILRHIFSIVFAWGTIALAGCGPTGDGDNSNGGDDIDSETGAISGAVTVLAQETRTSVIEQEPNDRLDDITAPISVGPSTRLELFGELSVVGGDLSDSFLFQVNTAADLEVQAILSFDFNPQNPPESDLALGISDLLATACSFGVDNQSFTTCFDTTKNPEIATFQAQSRFGLTVQALAGQAGYVLGLEFSEINSAASAHSSIHLRSDDENTADDAAVHGQVAVFDHYRVSHGYETVCAQATSFLNSTRRILSDWVVLGAQRGGHFGTVAGETVEL